MAGEKQNVLQDLATTLALRLNPITENDFAFALTGLDPEVAAQMPTLSHLEPKELEVGVDTIYGLAALGDKRASYLIGLAGKCQAADYVDELVDEDELTEETGAVDWDVSFEHFWDAECAAAEVEEALRAVEDALSGQATS